MRRILLILAALSVAAPAHAEWWEARTEHFIVYSESAAKPAEDFARKLERYDAAMRSVQKLDDSVQSDAQRLRVYRSGNRISIASLYGDSESGVAGFYIPRAGGSVAFVPSRELHSASRSAQDSELDSETVLLHEYTHHFMFQHFPATYPAWYTEGFAEFYSTIAFKDDGSFQLGNVPQQRVAALFASDPYRVSRLFDTERDLGFSDVMARYTMGWLLTHYLSLNPERTPQLRAYLAAINKGVRGEDAARQAFGDLDKLDSDLRGYLRRQPPGLLVRPANYRPPEVRMRRMSDAEEQVMRVHIRSQRGVDKKAAADVVRDARSRASLATDSVFVAMSLAEAEIDAKNYAEADRAADRALQLKPGLSAAMLFKGRVATERAKSAKTSHDIARKWFTDAATADRFDPRPMFYYYKSYVAEGSAIPERAIIALEHAYDLAPYDRELRLTLVNQLAVEGKAAEAASILGPLAFAPHQSKLGRKLRQAADALRANKLAEARPLIANVLERMTNDNDKDDD